MAQHFSFRRQLIKSVFVCVYLLRLRKLATNVGLNKFSLGKIENLTEAIQYLVPKMQHPGAKFHTWNSGLKYQVEASACSIL